MMQFGDDTSMADMAREIERLRAERDELVAALTEIAMENPSRSPAECARAAIAKAEGEK